MSSKNIIIGSLIFITFLTACSTPVTTTPVPPTETSTPIPPTVTSINSPSPTHTPILPTPSTTLTPSPTLVFATEPDQIIGTWSPLGSSLAAAMYTRFDKDGTCRQSQMRDLLETNPNVMGTYYFDGDQLVMLWDDESLRNLPPCGPEPAIYKVQILKNRHIQLILVDDQCSPRIVTMRREYERLR